MTPSNQPLSLPLSKSAVRRRSAPSSLMDSKPSKRPKLRKKSSTILNHALAKTAAGSMPTF